MDLTQVLYVGRFPFTIHRPNDDNGHLGHSRYFDYSDIAREKFLRSLDLSDRSLRRDHGIRFIIRSRKVDYKLPLFFGNQMDVQLEVALGREPFLRMDYAFYNPKGEIAFTDKTWNVFVDENTKGSVPIPDFFLEALRGKS